MKKDWKEDLRDKMLDFEQQPPEETWAHLEQKMFAEKDDNVVVLTSESRLSMIKKLWPYISIAAVLCIISLCVFYVVRTDTAVDTTLAKRPALNNKMDDGVESSISAASESLKPFHPSAAWKADRVKQHHGVHQPEMKLDQEQVMASTSPSADQKSNPDSGRTITMQDPVVATIHDEKHTADSGHPVTGIPKQMSNPVKTTATADYSEAGYRNKAVQRFKIDLISKELTPGFEHASAKFLIPSSGVSAGTGVNITDTLVSEILQANGSGPVSVVKKYRRPLTIGIMIHYPLTNRLSLVSGLNYIKSTYELQSGGPSNYIRSYQQTDDIGIPVQLSYIVKSGKKYYSYIIGGGMIEKSFQRSQKLSYVVNDLLKSENTDALTTNGIRSSFNIGAGIDYGISEKLGFFLEPNLRYYPGESNINTTESESNLPIGFNIRIGLRLSVKSKK
jgi:hypothetical protein